MMGLVIVAVLASVFAGIGGITSNISSVATGIIALIPAACALLAAQVKFQGKANWHYRKARLLGALERRLKYETADPPAGDEIAQISQELSALDEKLDGEWERELSLDYNFLRHAKEPGPPKQNR